MFTYADIMGEVKSKEAAIKTLNRMVPSLDIRIARLEFSNALTL